MRSCPCLLATLALLVAADSRAGTLVINPPALAFGSVPVGGGAVTSTLTITNAGTPTSISGFTMAFGCQEFTVSAPGLPGTLGNGASLVVNIAYDPYDHGTDSCTVTLIDSNASTDRFGLSGTGIAVTAELQVSPASLAFDDQLWNSGTGQTLNVTLTNVGVEPIESANLGRQLASGVHFSLGATEGLPIGPGESAIIPVTFDPSSVGLHADQITLSLDNDAPSASDATVSIWGTGLEENAGVSYPPPAGVQLAAGPSPTRGTLTVTYTLPHGGRLALEVCDLSGRVVARLRAHEPAAGERSLVLRDGTDWSPATGIYFVRASLDGRPLGSRRVLVLR